jgi:hypothetical protein
MDAHEFLLWCPVIGASVPGASAGRNAERVYRFLIGTKGFVMARPSSPAHYTDVRAAELEASAGHLRMTAELYCEDAEREPVM